MSAQLEVLRRRFENRTPGLLGGNSAFAVLCPLVERPGGLHLLFEVRAANLRQGGEVCFPGGKLEPGETPEAGALRETEEELGIPPREITLLGTPDFICNQRGFLLHPFLGLISPAGLLAMTPSPAEGAEVFTVPLSFFRNTPPEIYAYDLIPKPPEDFPYEAVGVSRSYPWAHGRVEVPVWYWEDKAVWGMTARIVRELAGAQGETPPLPGAGGGAPGGV